MDDPHNKVLSTLAILMEYRAQAAGFGSAYPFFFDFLQPEAKDLKELFKKDLDRTPLLERLQETSSGKHKFNQWMPDKVRISFSASLERDIYIQHRSRLDTFRNAAIGHTYRGGVINEMIDSLKTISDQ